MKTVNLSPDKSKQVEELLKPYVKKEFLRDAESFLNNVKEFRGDATLTNDSMKIEKDVIIMNGTVSNKSGSYGYTDFEIVYVKDEMMAIALNGMKRDIRSASMSGINF